VVIHEIRTILGGITQPAQCKTELPRITCIPVASSRQNHTLRSDFEPLPERSSDGLKRSDCRAAHVVVGITTILNDIYSEESTAIIGNGLIPLELIERLHAQPVGQALRDVEHIDRNQPLFDLSTRPAECCSVQGIDGVYAVTDKGTFAPAHYLLPKTDGPGQITNGIIVIDERVQNLRAG